MNNPFVITFKLKQHTPLIHFQHEQPGATLRATEVKPKLDRFIMEREVGCRENFDETKDLFAKKCAPWLIGKGKGANIALDYKIKIQPGPVTVQEINKDNNGLYFGDQGLPTDKSPKKYTFSEEPLTVTIHSFHIPVLEKIKAGVAQFFAIQNFGTRQNKGFGGFYIDEADSLSEDFETALQKCNNPIFVKSISGDWKTELKTAYQKLKSGVNSPYKKAGIFEYMCGNGLRWEKRKIKIELNKLITEGTLPDRLRYTRDPQGCKNSRGEYVNSWRDDDEGRNLNYAYVRALLGVAEKFDFLTGESNKDASYKYLVYITDPTCVIERFKSPVTFKRYKDKLYAILEPIPESVYDHPFRFEVKKQKRVEDRQKPGKFRWTTDRDEITIIESLKTPRKEQFSLEALFAEYSDGFQKL